jgi:hypothetical protein
MFKYSLRGDSKERRPSQNCTICPENAHIRRGPVLYYAAFT